MSRNSLVSCTVPLEGEWGIGGGGCVNDIRETYTDQLMDILKPLTCNNTYNMEN